MEPGKAYRLHSRSALDRRLLPQATKEAGMRPTIGALLGLNAPKIRREPSKEGHDREPEMRGR